MNQNLIFIIIVSLFVLTIQTFNPVQEKLKRLCKYGIYDPFTQTCRVYSRSFQTIAKRSLNKICPKGTSNSCNKNNSDK